jgi:hypothetical protein
VIDGLIPSPTIIVENVVLLCFPVSGAGPQALQLSLYSWIQIAVAKGVMCVHIARYSPLETGRGTGVYDTA